MTIRETILDVICENEDTPFDVIYGRVRHRQPYYSDADDLLAAVQSLVRDRWLISRQMRTVTQGSVLLYRKRTPAQHAQLMAELDGTQPKLL